MNKSTAPALPTWRNTMIALPLLLLIWSTISTEDLYAQQSKVYIPLAAGPIIASGAGGCDNLNANENEMESELVTAPGQQRPVFTCNRTLATVARERALDMATRNYFAHTNPDGLGPDFLVEQAGYNLPEYYSVTATSNHIESIAAGSRYNTAAAAWAGLMESEPHRRQLLATVPFYKEQSEYGVGFAYSRSSQYRNYWVFITAQPSALD